MKRSQCDKILTHIRRYGFITPLQAFLSYDVLAMHSRAAELRERGHNIRCKIVVKGGRRWGSYRLGRG